MDINELKSLSYEELRLLYLKFLNSQKHNLNVSQDTIDTWCSDTFYLWRHVGEDFFWSTVTDADFDNKTKNKEAKAEFIKYLSEHAPSFAKSADGYLSGLKQFRQFLANKTSLPVDEQQRTTLKQESVNNVKSPDSADTVSAAFAKNIILYGTPGTGKTQHGSICRFNYR